MSRELLTASMMGMIVSCMRKYFYRYELGLQSSAEHAALSFGSAWHTAMAARWLGKPADEALAAAVGDPPTPRLRGTGAHALDELQVATLSGLLTGYYRCYSTDPVRELRPEQEFQFPLAGSRTFDVAGKIDGLGALDTSRLALIEHKTTSDSVAPESDYWLRLRCNNQIMQYVHAARACRFPVEVIYYDVTRKPSIRPKQVPKQNRIETADEFGQRLAEDTCVRPEFYFARREVPILDQDLDEFVIQRLEISRMILALRRASRVTTRPYQAWPRNCSEMTCGFCEYKEPCLQGIEISASNPPIGFVVGERNPELQIA